MSKIADMENRPLRGQLESAEQMMNPDDATSSQRVILHASDALENVSTRESIEDCIIALKQESQRHALPGIRRGYLVACWAFIIPSLVVLAIHDFLIGEAYWAGFCIVVAGLLTQLFRITLSPTQAMLAKEVSRFDDVKNVGVLVDILEWPDIQAREAAAEALARLLPQMSPSDSKLLSTAQIQTLYSILALPYDKTFPHLQQAILEALAHIGGEDAIPVVEALAGRHANTDEEEQMIQTAKQCIESIKDRGTTAMLLRPVLESRDPESNLLRPLDAQRICDDDTLLRPDETERSIEVKSASLDSTEVGESHGSHSA